MHYPELNADTNMMSPSFNLKLLFSSSAEFRQALREYDINEKRQITCE